MFKNILLIEAQDPKFCDHQSTMASGLVKIYFQCIMVPTVYIK